MRLLPIGHINGNLHILAILIVYRIRAGDTYACWVDDDGCVYIAPSSHSHARAMLRHAPEQCVNTYRKTRGAALPCSPRDIHDDLADARSQHAQRTMGYAMEATA